VANVLPVPAFEQRDPVTLVILLKIDDPPLHREQNRSPTE
jgi:hypothetical protein